MKTIYAGLLDNPEVQVQDVIYATQREEVPYVVGGTEFTKGCIVLNLAPTGVAKPPLGLVPEFISIGRRLKEINSYYQRVGFTGIEAEQQATIESEIVHSVKRYNSIMGKDEFDAETFANCYPNTAQALPEDFLKERLKC